MGVIKISSTEAACFSEKFLLNFKLFTREWGTRASKSDYVHVRFSHLQTFILVEAELPFIKASIFNFQLQTLHAISGTVQL